MATSSTSSAPHASPSTRARFPFQQCECAPPGRGHGRTDAAPPRAGLALDVTVRTGDVVWVERALFGNLPAHWKCRRVAGGQGREEEEEERIRPCLLCLVSSTLSQVNCCRHLQNVAIQAEDGDWRRARTAGGGESLC